MDKLKSVLSVLKEKAPLISILVVVIMILNTNFEKKLWNDPKRVIEWDVISYYGYLPAIFIYGDLSLEFAENDPEQFELKIWFGKTPIGKNIIVTSMGLSAMYLPFFLPAHLLAPVLGYPADGFTAPYKFLLVFSSLFYFFLGLIFLSKILKRYVSPLISAFVIFAIGIGTNAYFYVTFNPAMAHSYNFFLFSLFLWLVIRFWENPNWKKAATLGFLVGFIALVRPTNILVLIFLMLWDVKSFSDLKDRASFFIKKFHISAILVFFFFVAWIPQFLYWKYTSGQFIFYSYSVKEASFFWGNPQIFNILLSYRKGWLVYTPIMTFALIGIFFILRKHKELFAPVLLFTVLNIYVQSSWWCWWYGGSFGSRVFIDSYPFMAIPLAVLLQYLFSWKRIAGFASIAVISCLIWYNQFQIIQYETGALHYWGMSKAAYWEAFLKKSASEKFWNLLTVPDYSRAREGIYGEISHNEYLKQIEDKMKAEQGEFNETFASKYTYDDISDEVKHATILEIADGIRQSGFLEDVKQKAEQKGIAVDSMIYLDAEWVFYNQPEKYIREGILKQFEIKIRRNQKYINIVRNKAMARKVTLDSMIILEAKYMYDNNFNL